jgi:RNA polymerase sigma-70 factor (ECF subfamily)
VDEASIRSFLAAEYPRLVGGLALICGSRLAAEDVVQEALARAWERSERGERIDSLAGWVTVVAMNLARSGLRRRLAERRARARLTEDPARSLEADVDSQVDVARALAELPRRQREATVLRYYLGLSVREVAAAMGVTEGTAKTNLFRARRALVAALGGTADVQEANDRAGS